MTLQGRHSLDLQNQCGYAKLRDIALNAPIGAPFRAKFSQYDILVSYKRLLTENMVPVGFWRNLVRNVFFCKLRHIGPFVRCCRADMLRQRTCRHVLAAFCCLCKLKSPMPWILLWRKIGLALLIVLLPTPYYIRLIIYYMFESTEVSELLADHFDQGNAYRVRQKSGPLKFFAVFLAPVSNFNLKFYRFIY